MYKNSKINMESLIDSDFLLGENMNIDNQNVNIDDLYDQKYMHKEIKKGIFLSEYQLEVLKKYQLDINSISSITELLFDIDEILDNEPDADDLEAIEIEISDFNYYANTNK